MHVRDHGYSEWILEIITKIIRIIIITTTTCIAPHIYLARHSRTLLLSN